MNLIDTHTHIYLKDFEEDQAQMINRALENNISALLLPNIDSNSISDLLKTVGEYPNLCFPMMGLHPCSVTNSYKSELSTIEHHLFSNEWMGVGEVGLDLYWDKTTFPAQEECFRHQIGWSKTLQLPLSIHSREATEEAIHIIEELQDGTLSGVFHCFSGTLEQAKRIIKSGFLLGVGGVLTYKKTNLPEIILEIGPDHLVLETDAPYLSPVPYRGKRNEPSYLSFVANKLAELLAVSVDEISLITTRNAVGLFKLKTTG